MSLSAVSSLCSDLLAENLFFFPFFSLFFYFFIINNSNNKTWYVWEAMSLESGSGRELGRDKGFLKVGR